MDTRGRRGTQHRRTGQHPARTQYEGVHRGHKGRHRTSAWSRFWDDFFGRNPSTPANPRHARKPAPRAGQYGHIT